MIPFRIGDEATPPAPAADGAGELDEADDGYVPPPEGFELLLRTYELAAHEHGKTGKNAIAVDASGSKLHAAIAALQAQQPGAQVVELVDLSTALARVRARASESGTAKQHGPQFAAGLRAAANMLEGMRIAQPPSIPEPSAGDVELAWSTLRSTTQPRDSCACDGDMRAVLTTYTARLRERIGGAR